MVTFCFFISMAYSYCYSTQPVKIPPPIRISSVIERSTEMIARYEGCQLKAYPDTRGWSIGYGTRSFAGEVITHDEAYARFQGIVGDSINRIRHDFPLATEDEMVALTSLFYNCWS